VLCVVWVHWYTTSKQSGNLQMTLHHGSDGRQVHARAVPRLQAHALVVRLPRGQGRTLVHFSAQPDPLEV